MVKLFVTSFLVLTIFFLTGCKMQEYNPPRYTDQPVLQYMRDRNGICYAYTGSVTTYGNIVYSIATVPCEKVGL